MERKDGIYFIYENLDEFFIPHHYVNFFEVEEHPSYAPLTNKKFKNHAIFIGLDKKILEDTSLKSAYSIMFSDRFDKKKENISKIYLLERKDITSIRYTNPKGKSCSISPMYEESVPKQLGSDNKWQFVDVTDDFILISWYSPVRNDKSKYVEYLKESFLPELKEILEMNREIEKFEKEMELEEDF